MVKLEYCMGMLMMILLIIMYLLSVNYLHPIILIILMILYSLVVCLLLSMKTYNYMYSIMFFLIMISGLLIIFLYFASLISNEENKIKLNMSLLVIMFLNLMVMFYFMGLMKYSMYYSMEFNKFIDINMLLMNNIIKIYYYPYNNFTLLCLLYLLITLFVVIKICSVQAKSLRKLNYE